MDLALLRTFVTVHRAGSFTRAASLLGLSQPAVTSQIRTLERQLGRPLFLRRARGVTPTTIGDELAHRAAPHLDALVEIAETELDDESGVRTLHLAGPPEFTSLRALPALAPLIAQGLALRSSFSADTDETLEGLAAGHHDLAIVTARPRGGLLTATPLCDEEHVLIAAPRWAGRLGPGTLRRNGPVVLEQLPVVEVHESLPLVSRYWARSSTPGPQPPGPSSHRISGPSWNARQRAPGWPSCPAISARARWNEAQWWHSSTLRCHHCAPTSSPRGPARSRCRISLARTSGCCGPQPTGDRRAVRQPSGVSEGVQRATLLP